MTMQAMLLTRYETKLNNQTIHVSSTGLVSNVIILHNVGVIYIVYLNLLFKMMLESENRSRSQVT